MKKLLLNFSILTSVISVGAPALAAGACFSDDKAHDILLSKEAFLRKEIKQKYSQSASRSRVAQSILNAQWDESRQAYFTGSLHYWECAAGARCWVHATLNCNGEVALVEIGD